jgi:hypothetical protein
MNYVNQIIYKNIDLAQAYSIYFNNTLNSLSIIYINSNFYTFTKNFNSAIKLIKYKTNSLNKPLFISSQNT